MTLALFHDFPGLENDPTKFPDFPGRVVTVIVNTAGMSAQHTGWNENDTINTEPLATVCQKVPTISQGSVATHFACGGIVTDDTITSLLSYSLMVKACLTA